jgi:hypothetical protein
LELGIPDTNENYISDGDIKKAVMDHHDRQLVLEVSRSKKMMENGQDNFKEVQGYWIVTVILIIVSIIVQYNKIQYKLISH